MCFKEVVQNREENYAVYFYCFQIVLAVLKIPG